MHTILPFSAKAGLFVNIIKSTTCTNPFTKEEGRGEDDGGTDA
jgi:hypothetical protein